MVLLDIVEKVKQLECEKKDSPYLKLTELFFKGIDLREKLSGKEKTGSHALKVATISNLDIDNI